MQLDQEKSGIVETCDVSHTKVGFDKKKYMYINVEKNDVSECSQSRLGQTQCREVCYFLSFPVCNEILQSNFNGSNTFGTMKPGAFINPHWLELSLSRTNFHGPKGVRAIEVRLYINVEKIMFQTAASLDLDRLTAGRCVTSYHSLLVELQWLEHLWDYENLRIMVL